MYILFVHRVLNTIDEYAKETSFSAQGKLIPQVEVPVMETAVFLGLLGLGYVASQQVKKTKEGFDGNTNGGPDAGSLRIGPNTTYSVSERDKYRAAGANTTTREQVYTPPNQPTIPGDPRSVNTIGAGTYDLQFLLPSGGSLPAQPDPSQLQENPLHFPVPPLSLPTQDNPDALATLQIRPDHWEDATARPAYVSALSGVEFKPGEFKHQNMVPFFRGSVKQNMIDTANNQTLDAYSGSAKTLFAKREQGPFFDPNTEPIGNPFGFESVTNFMESRIVAPNNRGGERPVEPEHVGPGLNQGYTNLPSGGYQQQEGEEYIIQRMPRTNDLRTENNPKLTYAPPVVPGSHFVTTGGTAETIGDVIKHTPDTFYLNEHGERNFVTVADTTKPAVRSTQVLKHVTRPDTSKAYDGIAGQTDGKATYTVASTRTPLVKQMGSWGFRNANLTEFFDKNTDAPENDYGRNGVEILPNERSYTTERTHGLNVTVVGGGEITSQYQDIARPTRAQETEDFNWLGGAAPAEAQPKLTVYDPNDIARTTIKETTEDNDYIGIFSPGAAGAQKLTIYDPEDIARVTGRNTLAQQDLYRNWGSTAAGIPAKAESRLQDPVHNTQRAALSAKSAWSGPAAPALTTAETNRQAAYDMRQYAQRENISRGRKPEGSSVKLFNGEDNIHLQYRKLNADSINDREPGVDRVDSNPTSMAVIGLQRPRQVLKLDISAVRNEPVVVAALERNPYVIPLHRAAMVGGRDAI